MDTKLLGRSLQYHGASLLKCLNEDQQELPSTGIFSFLERKQPEMEIKDERFLASVRSFIARKSDLLFKPYIPEEKEKEDSEASDLYAIMPPLDAFAGVPSYDREAHFLASLSVDDCVTGVVKTILDSGLLIRLLCVDVGPARHIQDLDITAYCPAKELPRLYAKESALDAFQEKDIVRGIVLSVDSERIILSLHERSIPDVKAYPRIGLITEDEFPVHFRRESEIEDRTYEDLLHSIMGFNNSGNVKALLKKQGVREEHSYLRYMSRLQIPEKEYAEGLKKWQSQKLAHQSVAQGVDKFKSGSYQEAMQHFNKALQIDDTNVEALVARGALLANKEIFEKAVADFRQALSLNPAHGNARNYLVETLLTMGKSYEDSRRLKDACDVYKQVLDVDAENQEATDMLDDCHKLLAIQAESGLTASKSGNDLDSSRGKGKDKKHKKGRHKSSSSSEVLNESTQKLLQVMKIEQKKLSSRKKSKKQKKDKYSRSPGDRSGKKKRKRRHHSSGSNSSHSDRKGRSTKRQGRRGRSMSSSSSSSTSSSSSSSSSLSYSDEHRRKLETRYRGKSEDAGPPLLRPSSTSMPTKLKIEEDPVFLSSKSSPFNFFSKSTFIPGLGDSPPALCQDIMPTRKEESSPMRKEEGSPKIKEKSFRRKEEGSPMRKEEGSPKIKEDSFRRKEEGSPKRREMKTSDSPLSKYSHHKDDKGDLEKDLLASLSRGAGAISAVTQAQLLWLLRKKEEEEHAKERKRNQEKIGQSVERKRAESCDRRVGKRSESRSSSSSSSLSHLISSSRSRSRSQNRRHDRKRRSSSSSGSRSNRRKERRRKNSRSMSRSSSPRRKTGTKLVSTIPIPMVTGVAELDMYLGGRQFLQAPQKRPVESQHHEVSPMSVSRSRLRTPGKHDISGDRRRKRMGSSDIEGGSGRGDGKSLKLSPSASSHDEKRRPYHELQQRSTSEWEAVSPEIHEKQDRVYPQAGDIEEIRDGKYSTSCSGTREERTYKIGRWDSQETMKMLKDRVHDMKREGLKPDEGKARGSMMERDTRASLRGSIDDRVPGSMKEDLKNIIITKKFGLRSKSPSQFSRSSSSSRKDYKQSSVKEYCDEEDDKTYNDEKYKSKRRRKSSIDKEKEAMDNKELRRQKKSEQIIKDSSLNDSPTKSKSKSISYPSNTNMAPRVLMKPKMDDPELVKNRMSSKEFDAIEKEKKKRKDNERDKSKEEGETNKKLFNMDVEDIEKEIERRVQMRLKMEEAKFLKKNEEGGEMKRNIDDNDSSSRRNEPILGRCEEDILKSREKKQRYKESASGWRKDIEGRKYFAMRGTIREQGYTKDKFGNTYFVGGKPSETSTLIPWKGDKDEASGRGRRASNSTSRSMSRSRSKSVEDLKSSSRVRQHKKDRSKSNSRSKSPSDKSKSSKRTFKEIHPSCYKGRQKSRLGIEERKRLFWSEVSDDKKRERGGRGDECGGDYHRRHRRDRSSSPRGRSRKEQKDEEGKEDRKKDGEVKRIDGKSRWDQDDDEDSKGKTEKDGDSSVGNKQVGESGKSSDKAKAENGKGGVGGGLVADYEGEDNGEAEEDGGEESLTELEKFLKNLKQTKKKQWIAEGKIKDKE